MARLLASSFSFDLGLTFVLLSQTNTDSTGLWDFERFPPAKSQYQPKPATTSFITLGKVEGPSSVVIPSLVSIEFFVPFSIDGVHGTVVCGVSPQCISYYTV